MARRKVVNGGYYDLTAEEEAELDARAEAADLDMNGYARSVHVDELAVRMEELTDSVAYLLERDHAR